MKKIILTIIGIALASPAWSAQTAVTQISGTQASVGALKTQVNTKLGTVESNRQDHESRVDTLEGKTSNINNTSDANKPISTATQTALDLKAAKASTVMLWSEWSNGASFTTSSPPVYYNGALYKCIAPYTKSYGEYPDTQTDYFAEVTGSGGVVDLSNYLSKTNTTAFAPSSDYHPATKKYVDDSIAAGGGYTDEQAQDAVGGMFTGNTETGITVTYNDTTGKVDFVVATQSDVNFTSTLNTKLSGIATGAEVNVNADWNSSSGDSQILNKPTIPTISDAAYGSGWNGDTGAASKNAIYDKIETIAGGSMNYPGAGIPVSTGSAWGTSITPGTGVTTALVAAVDGTGGLASKASLDALPSIVFGTGFTVAEDTPSAGTDTVSITANTYQAYDANMIVWPSTISATEVGYLNGLTEVISTSLSGKQAADPQLDTWAGVAPGTGVTTAIAANTGAVGGLPTIIASGAYTVDTASINANTCASAVAVTASGVVTTDVIIATPNTILSSVTGFGVTTAGSVRVDVYPTSGNVNFQFCNPTGAAIDPGSVTFNWKVIR